MFIGTTDHWSQTTPTLGIILSQPQHCSYLHTDSCHTLHTLITKLHSATHKYCHTLHITHTLHTVTDITTHYTHLWHAVEGPGAELGGDGADPARHRAWEHRGRYKEHAARSSQNIVIQGACSQKLHWQKVGKLALKNEETFRHKK